jgi:GNAT superfamily N-acetyltransferase
MQIRAVTSADIPGAHHVVTAGFASYATFAPPGWEPPPDMGAEGLAERLAREGAYGIVAVEEDEVVGFAAYGPAREETDEGFVGPLLPGLAHVWAVFVAESYWGRGLARRLLAALTDHIRDAGYAGARLYVAAGQARARAFYAREGWREATEPFLVEKLGLEVLEMRRSLEPAHVSTSHGPTRATDALS